MLHRLLALVATCVVVLSGCRLGVEVDVDVRPDGSGVVSVRLTADPELVTRAPGLADDLRLDDLRAAGWAVTGPQPTPDGGLTLLLERPFADPEEANRLLGALNGPGGPLRDVRVDVERSFGRRTTTLTGGLQLDGLAAFGDAGLTAALGTTAPFGGAVTDPASSLDVSVVLRTPGEVRTTTGTVTTAGGVTEVRWDARPIGTAARPLQATVDVVDREALAARDRERAARTAFVVWLGLVAVAAVGAVVWAGRRRRRPARL